MTHRLNVVALNGNPAPSIHGRTAALLEHQLQALQQHLPIQAQRVELAAFARGLGQALLRSEAPPAAEQALQRIEAADLLLVAVPVYRGTYPGLFKHLVDFIGIDTLIDVPVLLAASGGSDRHALVIDHQLRPLFSFLQAQTLPIGVYAGPQDLPTQGLPSAALQARIDLAAARAAGLFAASATPPLRRSA